MSEGTALACFINNICIQPSTYSGLKVDWYGYLNHMFDGSLNEASLRDDHGHMDNFFLLVRVVVVVHEFFRCHWHGYLNHMFDGVLNEACLRD